MPHGDRTGPWGHGPMTGRAIGFCAGHDAPGFMNQYGLGGGRGFGRGFGRGRGRGLGRGWGWRNRAPYWPSEDFGPVYGPGYAPAPSREDQKAYLEDIRRSLEQELEDIRKRIAELSEAVEE